MAPGWKTRFDAFLQDRSLRDPNQLGNRIDALEQLESWIVHDVLPPSLRPSGEALMAELESVNRRLFQRIGHDIRHGKGAETLRAWAASLRRSSTEEEGYGPLDTLISGVLDFEEPPDALELAPEMVFYQPTPAQDIFNFIRQASLTPDDVVMDLGAGLGHVTLLAAICSSARCVGIELQPAYVASARQCAEKLQVRNAQFIAQDVRDVDMSDGTVFYLYTPFTGSILRTVLGMLKREAESRVIRVCTLGPCTDVVASEPWLRLDAACGAKRTALFRSL